MTLQPLIDLARQRGGLGPDDLVACLAPLFRQRYPRVRRCLRLQQFGMARIGHAGGGERLLVQRRRDDRGQFAAQGGAGRPGDGGGGQAPALRAHLAPGRGRVGG